MVLSLIIPPSNLFRLLDQFFHDRFIHLFILPLAFAEQDLPCRLIRSNYIDFLIHMPPFSPFREKMQFSIQREVLQQFCRYISKDRIKVFVEIPFYQIKDDLRFSDLYERGVWINIPEPESEKVVLQSVVAHPCGFFL